MKRVIVKVAAAALLIGGLAFNFSVDVNRYSNDKVSIEVLLKESSAFGERNKCKNGCVSGSGGCRCNGYHRNMAEAS